MTSEDVYSVRLDANGDPDVAFYLARAHDMRGQAVRDGARAISQAVRGWLAQLMPHLPGAPIHH